MEKVEIFNGSSGNIDFKHPVSMTKDEFNKFSNLMRKLFFPVVITEVDKFDRKRLDTKRPKRVFHKEEYEYLITSPGWHEASAKLGMPIGVVADEMGDVFPKYFSWCKNKSIDERLRHAEEVIKEFSVEYENKKEKSKKIFQMEIKPRRKESHRLSRRVYQSNKKLPELDKLAEQNKGTRTGKDAELKAKSIRMNILEFEKRIKKINEEIDFYLSQIA